jgi:uncharacterized protein (DUF1697 family)
MRSDWIALLRGINVGGHNKLPMKDLRTALEEAGFDAVQTYIQSGNIVCTSHLRSAAGVGEKIGAVIEKEFFFRPQVFVLNADRFESLVAANPFPDAVADPSRLHVFFLDAEPGVSNLEKLRTLQGPREAFEVIDKALYLYAPDGIGRSKLAASIDRSLRVGVTARNWRTVEKLRQLAS